ncbi:hypothetical protein EJ06DRAFT_287433 [Trichodelitschia bisporula]|uniref:tRNA-splicing endonuclease subunit Sen15 domain-containing protein n=1 Tax=Trichodelitschia bisporula TaxID=703511 RepID=A0A6G1I5U0_9PEZI|nr:hypothetical protein EJ06DRAFT_287433 [Trichodelitschia bisporula]
MALASDVPTPSALESTLRAQSQTRTLHDVRLHHLALQVLHNLQHQHRWTRLTTHTFSPLTGAPLPRPLISGLPPARLYVHPDEQIELLKVEAERKRKGEEDRADGGGKEDVFGAPEREWVLPTHLMEKWSLRQFAEVFDAITVAPLDEEAGEGRELKGNKWRTTKRVVMATVQDDSTVVYYLVHNGIVKPRQN